MSLTTLIARRPDKTAAPPKSSEAVKGRQLLGIQAARGIAALLVVIYHSGKELMLPQYLGHIPLGNIFSFGHAGVDFFFVLSGFIIAHVHQRDVGQPATLPHYAKRRVARIYPIYWFVTAIVIALDLATAEGRQRLQPGHVVASLLLWPHASDPLLGVAWTLQHEMLFYILFALAILNRRLGVLLLSAGVVVIGLSMAHPPGIGFLGSAYNLQFVMGIAAANIVQHCRLPAPRLVAGAGAAGFLLVGLAENAGLIAWAGTPGIMLFGLASTVIVVGLAQAEQAGSLHVGSLGVLFGNASYSLYLIHTIVIGLTARALATLHILPLMPEWSVVILVTGGAIIAALGLHLLVEKPVLESIRRAGFR